MPTEHTIHLNQPWFEYVRSGKKKYEGRRYWKKTKDFQVGDTLKILPYNSKNEEPYTVLIENIIHFKTFEQALMTLPMEEVLPEIKNIEEGVKIYFQYVSLETQLKEGIIMIKIKLSE